VNRRPSYARRVAQRRDAAKQKTRRALLEAARQVFTEQGLWEPSLDAICQRAGFTRGAFYVHFRSREDLVGAVMEQSLRQVVDGVIATEGGEEDLEATIGRYVAVSSLLREEPLRHRGVRFHQLLEACHRTPGTGRFLAEILQDATRRLARAAAAAQAAGRASRDLEPDDLASVLLLMALGVIVAEEVDLPIDLEATHKAVLRLISADG